jgi:hypothetical protein
VTLMLHLGGSRHGLPILILIIVVWCHGGRDVILAVWDIDLSCIGGRRAYRPPVAIAFFVVMNINMNRHIVLCQ